MAVNMAVKLCAAVTTTTDSLGPFLKVNRCRIGRCIRELLALRTSPFLPAHANSRHSKEAT